LERFDIHREASLIDEPFKQPVFEEKKKHCCEINTGKTKKNIRKDPNAHLKKTLRVMVAPTLCGKSARINAAHGNHAPPKRACYHQMMVAFKSKTRVEGAASIRIGKLPR